MLSSRNPGCVLETDGGIEREHGALVMPPGAPWRWRAAPSSQERPRRGIRAIRAAAESNTEKSNRFMASFFPASLKI
jgi:hypothetical protein